MAGLKRAVALLLVFSSVFAFSITERSCAGVLSGPISNPGNGHLYYLLTQENWTNSEAEAITLGGHLTTINDAGENNWVATTFANYGGVSRALWIGLNDAAVTGDYVWASGEPVTYTNWGPGEPTHSGNSEHWVHIFPTSDPIIVRYPFWNDAPDYAYSFGYTFNGVAEVVPEPSTIALFGMGLIGMIGWAWRKRKA